MKRNERKVILRHTKPICVLLHCTLSSTLVIPIGLVQPLVPSRLTIICVGYLTSLTILILFVLDECNVLSVVSDLFLWLLKVYWLSTNYQL